MATILVIDDDDTVVTFMTQALQDSHKVLAFQSWSKAMPAISGVEIDLALIDVKLKGFQGNHVAKVLRPIIRGKIYLFSSHSHEVLKKLSEECGADGYIHKVLKLNLLRDKINSVLATPQKQSAPKAPSSSSMPRPAHSKNRSSELPSAEAIARNDPNAYLLRDFASQFEGGGLDQKAFVTKHPYYFLLQLNQFESSKATERKNTKSSPSSDSHVPDDPFDVAVFTVQSHNREGWGNIITLGRSVKSDIVLARPDVSGFHAYFRRSKGGDWSLRDGRGEFGTYVDGRRLEKGETTGIKSKMVLTFGSVTHLKFLKPEDMFQRVRFFMNSHHG